MPKVKLTVEERLVYVNEIVVEKPEGIPDEEFKAILNKVERTCDDTRDVVWALKHRHGLKIVSVTNNFPDSPDVDELEIVDVKEESDK